jgi:hypothetical protein
MDPQMLNMLIYAGVALAGYGVHWLQARQAQPAAPPIPVNGVPTSPTPAPADHVTIGHGALLKLMLGALTAGASSIIPAMPAAPALPAPSPTPPAQPIDLNALIRLLQQPQAPQPAASPAIPVS